jgi:hypothetical protein
MKGRHQPGKSTAYQSPVARPARLSWLVAVLVTLGLREKFIAKRRDVRIVDRGFGKPPLFFRGQLAGLLWVKPVVGHWKAISTNRTEARNFRQQANALRAVA